jgi:hypothetical protein
MENCDDPTISFTTLLAKNIISMAPFSPVSDFQGCPNLKTWTTTVEKICRMYSKGIPVGITWMSILWHFETPGFHGFTVNMPADSTAQGAGSQAPIRYFPVN